MKFQKPSKVQERALPLLVSNPYSLHLPLLIILDLET
jgi:hypothetical protein